MPLSAVREPQIEVCPFCGEFVDELIEETGWCDRCHVLNKHGRVSSSPCENCHRYFPGHGRLCSGCKERLAPPRCAMCRARLHAHRRSVFCSKPECLAAKARYMYYRRIGLTKKDAVRRAKDATRPSA